MSTARQVFHALGAYLKAQLQNAIIVVLLFVVAFAITGVPWWLLTGALCGMLNLIPHLGPVISLGLALLLNTPPPTIWSRYCMSAGLAGHSDY